MSNILDDLTLIIFTHRHDKRFELCLKSAQFCDQVVIYDHGSGNDWDALHKKFHFSVKKIDSLESFSRLRNSALKNSKTQWVMFLDSDEFLTVDAQRSIAQAMSHPEAESFSFQRIDIFLGKPLLYGEVANVWITRLIKKGSARFVGDAHEVVDSDSTHRLDGIIFHTPHTSIHEFIQKINLYTQILSKTNESAILLKLLFFPPLKFLGTFIIKLGFLDGTRGLVYSVCMSLHSQIVRIKRYEHSLT